MNTARNDVHPSKRRRKDPSDTRAERKRELDRIAQRATRERTKNRIADLELRIASLESGDKNSEISQLTRTIDELRKENGRYRNSLAKLRVAIDEALGESDGSVRRVSTSSSSPTPKSEAPRTNSITTFVPEAIENVDHTHTDTFGSVLANFDTPSQAHRLQACYETHGYRSPTPYEIGNFDINSIYEFFEYGSGNPFANPSPLTGRMPPEGGFVQIAADEHKWTTSDDAFHRGLQANPLMMDLDEGLLAKAILIGWESIGPAAQHPILSALHCVDRRVFGKWTSKPQRLALMFICGTAMQWRANPTADNRSKVPHWFLPRPAQNRIDHPLVIDFLVWPGLRERLVFEYEKYTVNGDFSFCFVEYFHFHFPYPDEQVARYDPQTGLICGLSKLFRDHVFDLKNWTMLPAFFNSFPEMRADIDMFVEPPTVGYQKGSWV